MSPRAGVRAEVTFDAAVAMVEREARNAFAAVESALVDRKNHPSYGVTKDVIRTHYHRAVGLAQAASLLAGRGATETAGFFYAQDVMGIDLRDLTARIKAA